MREVSKDEFFATVGPLDVHPTIVTRFPYTSEWRFHRQLGAPLFGKTVGRMDGATIRTSYFIQERP
jgi:hypothetical protein